MAFLRYAVLSFWIMTGLCTNVFAQKSAELKKIGFTYFEHERWYDAMVSLSQYQQEKPGDLKVLTALGICFYQLHDVERSRQYFEHILSQDKKNVDPDLYYYYARLLHGQSDYQNAIFQYKAFLKVASEKHPFRANAIDNIKRCLSGMRSKPNEAVALVENLGDHVNSVGDEFAPIPSVNFDNRIYFSAAREGCQGYLRNEQGIEDAIGGKWCSDMFLTNLTNQGWDHGVQLGALLNTPRHEVVLDFNENGKVLYYFRGYTLYSGDVYADTSGRTDEYAVTPPSFVSPMQPEEGDCAPFFYNDSTLLFASRRKGGFGGLDLYFAQKKNGEWTAAENLGPTINSPYDETTPFLAKNGRTLYFSSNNSSTMGGFDVFKAVFMDKKKAWSELANLGVGINSPGNDTHFRTAKDGKSAFFASDRLDSYGERDIYVAYYKEELTLEMLASTPRLFFEVGQIMAVENTSTDAPVKDEVVESVMLKPLYYDADNDLLSPENMKSIQEVTDLARNYPDLAVVVTAHTDETGPIKFDLYYGIKRAEIVGKALVEQGIPAARIILRSAGPNYPVAKDVLGQDENLIGKKLNRRVELSLASTGRMPVETVIQKPVVPEIMMADGALELEDMDEGLAYKVEVAVTRQVFASDVLGMFNDILIESTPGINTYRYTAGFFKNYKDAAALQVELLKQDFPDAIVIAYINGIRISKAEARGFVKKYPDLSAYVKK